MNYATAERLLTISALNLAYGDKIILRDVSLDIDNITRPNMSQGQVVALLGPSGVGKTQLFRCIAGLQPFTGNITFKFADGDRSAHAGEVGVVQQQYPLLNDRTVWGNMLVAAHRDPSRIEKAKQLLEHFGLSDKLNSYPMELSGGQRQRVAIVQQLTCSSHYLLMDEPFSGLDVIAKKKVMETITTVTTAHEHNTVIFTTHDLESAVQIADQIWVLGREQGKPGATVRERINLAAIGLAWEPNIIGHPLYWPTVKQLLQTFETL